MKHPVDVFVLFVTRQYCCKLQIVTLTQTENSEKSMHHSTILFI